MTLAPTSPIGIGALGRAAPWAIVPEELVQALAEEFNEAGEGVRALVNEGLARFDEKQGPLSAYVSACLDDLTDPTALALGHFLAVATYLVFERAFGGRLRRVDEEALNAAREALVTENELQEREPHLRLSAGASVATIQPHVTAFIDQNMEAALEAEEPASEEALGTVFGTVLVVVVALSHAVQPPEGAAPTAGQA